MELGDFLPTVTKIESTLGLLSVVSFTKESASLTVYNTDDPKEFIVFESPMSEANLKGCHAVQNLGAVETYIRRYLYNIAYEIVECDGVDGVKGKKDEDLPFDVPDNEPEDLSFFAAITSAKETRVPGSDARVGQLSKAQLERLVNNDKPTFAEARSAAKLILDTEKGLK